MVTATRISKIVGVSEEEVISKSLISFLEREIRLAEADIADIRERYNVLSKEELYEAIKSLKIASHPAWEDYIVWKNKEQYIADLKEQLKLGR
jgi:ABC-type phosphate/phosphonate transport system ATPase subunit